MSDIELVIKIPEHTYEECKKVKLTEALEGVPFHVMKAIANGISLPKGHGDLIDRQELLKSTLCKTFGLRSVDIENAPTIIEADRGDEE